MKVVQHLLNKKKKKESLIFYLMSITGYKNLLDESTKQSQIEKFLFNSCTPSREEEKKM